MSEATCGISNYYKFRLQFNQYKSSLKFYGNGERDFKQKKLLAHFCSEHNLRYMKLSPFKLVITTILTIRKDGRIFEISNQKVYIRMVLMENA